MPTEAAVLSSPAAATGKRDAKRKRDAPQSGDASTDKQPKKQRSDISNSNKASKKTAAAASAANSNKRKKKKKKSKRMKQSATAAASASAATAKQTKSSRDCSAELSAYLRSWSASRSGDGTAGWKFNKKLQLWALEHCFDKRIIDNALFKELLPYIATVQGNAAERLSARALRLIQSNGETDIDENESATDEQEQQQQQQQVGDELEEDDVDGEVDNAAVLAERAKVKAEVAKVALKRALKVHSQIQAISR